MTETQQLLAEYIKTGSETAFRELVARYINFVYSTALRLVDGDSHLAQDVTQVVFIGLAQKGRTLSREVMLGGWLHQHTFHVATKAMRSENRRKFRENEAAQMNAPTDDSATSLRQVAPLLDEAITQLGADDRTAILLRFFEQRDFRSVGAALGSNEDAARMRVNRALEKLHTILKRRGVTLSVAALATALTAEAVTAAPVGLAGTVAGTALASVAVGASATATLLKLMTFSKIQAGIIGAIAIAGVVAPLSIQHQAGEQLRAKDEALQQQSDQLAALTTENSRLADQMAQASNSQALSQQQLNNLLRLRNEVGALKVQLADAAKIHAQPPPQPAPAIEPPPVDPREQARQEALSRLQAYAKMNNAKSWLLAFLMYADKAQGQFPTNFDAVTPFLSEQFQSGSMFTTNLFEIVYQGPMSAITNPSSTIVLREMPDPAAMVRTYGFADGHVEIHKPENGDFQAYESQHMIPPPAGQ